MRLPGQLIDSNCDFDRHPCTAASPAAAEETGGAGHKDPGFIQMRRKKHVDRYYYI